MSSRLVPAREIMVGDTLRYLQPDPLVVTKISAAHSRNQYWLIFEHATGRHRASIFAHLHKETDDAKQ